MEFPELFSPSGQIAYPILEGLRVVLHKKIGTFLDLWRVYLPPEDMFPPIDRELFEKEMIIEPIQGW